MGDEQDSMMNNAHTAAREAPIKMTSPLHAKGSVEERADHMSKPTQIAVQLSIKQSPKGIGREFDVSEVASRSWGLGFRCDVLGPLPAHIITGLLSARSFYMCNFTMSAAYCLYDNLGLCGHPPLSEMLGHK